MNAKAKSLIAITVFLLALITPNAFPVDSSSNSCQETQKELIRRLFLISCRASWQATEIQLYETHRDVPKWLTAEDLRNLIRNDANDCRSHYAAAVLLLAQDSTKEAYELLLQLLADKKDGIVCLNAARVLAYHGHKEGLELLKRTASGKNIFTQSGFEIDAAALALLLLNEHLPPEYFTQPLVDKLYIKLDAQNH